MVQIFGLGAPLMEFFARYVVWLYMPAIMCFLISYRLLNQALAVFLLHHDLQLKSRFQVALKPFFGACQGVVIGVILFLCIYFRKELFQCVASVL